MKTGKKHPTAGYHHGCTSFIKLLFAAGMAVAIHTSCGGGDSDEFSPSPTPTPVQPGAPSITVGLSEVNVFGGAKVEQKDSTLLIGGEKTAWWTSPQSKVKTVYLTFNGSPFFFGNELSEKGTLSLFVENQAGKSANRDITVKADGIFGTDAIGPLQVDEEKDLISGLTFATGITLLKVEIEQGGQRTEIADPHHYTPGYPGQCSLIFTVTTKSGVMAEVRVDNQTIKPLDFNEATVTEANMISEKYPWYRNLQRTTKEFIYPHLIASYAACNRSKQDDRVHIIMGETTDASDVENIGQYNDPSDHAYEGYYRIRALSQETSIKGCHDSRNNLKEYINQHPNKIYIISQAAGSLSGISWEGFNNNPETAPQKALLENENVVIIGSGGNRRQAGWKTYNENIKNGDYYTRSATNSNKNNKITVTGYNSWGGDNYFSPRYSIYGGLRSAMPVGYDKDKGNIVMPMMPLISSHNNEDVNSTSSYPTAVTSGIIGNAISIIMSNHPGITAEDAMTIIVNNYLREETFQYMDETTNFELVDGDKWYFIEIEKLLNNELLQADKLDALQFNADEVALPAGKGICYMGMGVQMEFNGKRYDMTGSNQTVILEALKSGNAKWYWNKDRFKKYGGTNTAAIKVFVTDKDGNRIPDLQLNINKTVTE